MGKEGIWGDKLKNKHKSKLIVILGSRWYGEPFSHLGKISTSIADIVDKRENIQLVVFTGGEDIHPSFYNGRDCGVSQTNIKRDSYEERVFKRCLKDGIKMAGICRGSQFLNVMAGGFMYQHITGHAMLGVHGIIYPALDRRVLVTSTHHQLIGLAESGIPIAYTDGMISQRYVGPQGDIVSSPAMELEAAVFPEINALGAQFHPEWMRDSMPGKMLYRMMVEDFINFSMENFITKYGYKERKENGKEIRATESN